MRFVTFCTPDYEQFIDPAIPFSETVLLQQERPHFWSREWGKLMMLKVGAWLDNLGDEPLCVMDADVRLLAPIKIAARFLANSAKDRDAAFQFRQGICPGVMVLNPVPRTRIFLEELRKRLGGGEFNSEQQAARFLQHTIYYRTVPSMVCSHRRDDNPMILHAAGIKFEEKASYLAD